jgi:hypothetical protein
MGLNEIIFFFKFNLNINQKELKWFRFWILQQYFVATKMMTNEQKVSTKFKKVFEPQLFYKSSV